MKTNRTKQDRAKCVDILSVQVVPDLAVAVDRASTVDVDVGAAELEEGRGILKDLLEGVCLPVIGVVGELDRSLDVCPNRVNAILQRTGRKRTKIDVLEEG